jgi:hypothetical protein
MENVTQESDGYKYTINSQAIENEKNALRSKYPAITGWQQFTKERWFNINGEDKIIDPYFKFTELSVRSTEKYWVPMVNISGSPDGTADTSDVPGIGSCQTNFGSPAGSGLINSDSIRVGRTTRVQNVVNLDNCNNLYVMIKKIPRMLRGVDLLATIYRYGAKGLYRPRLGAPPPIPNDIDEANMNGHIDNQLYMWVALQKNKTSNNLEYAALPDFFRLQNEMIFRSFFGSTERIENKGDMAPTLLPWEMIPYEYEP